MRKCAYGSHPAPYHVAHTRTVLVKSVRYRVLRDHRQWPQVPHVAPEPVPCCRQVRAVYPSCLARNRRVLPSDSTRTRAVHGDHLRTVRADDAPEVSGGYLPRPRVARRYRKGLHEGGVTVLKTAVRREAYDGLEPPSFRESFSCMGIFVDGGTLSLIMCIVHRLFCPRPCPKSCLSLKMAMQSLETTI